MDLGPHAFFIAAAYAVTALILAGLVASALLVYRAQLRALAELEGTGARRRSATPLVAGEETSEPVAASRSG
jgi:heme exporter protein D